MSKKTVQIKTRYGTMTFKSWIEAYEFRETIATWSGFTEETRPTRVEEAVEYHLAYVEGGFAEVRHVMRERERVIAEQARSRQEHGGLPRELWGMPQSVIEEEWARRMRMGYYGW